VDAHSFEPSTKDMMKLASSDLFIYTGAGIEGFADKAVESLKNEKVTVVKAAENIQLLSLESEHQHEESVEENAQESNEEHIDEGNVDEHGHTLVNWRLLSVQGITIIKLL